MRLAPYLVLLAKLSAIVAATPAAYRNSLTSDPLYFETRDEPETDIIEVEARAARRPYVKAVLATHNAHRANHSALPLVWNTTMTDNARVLAQRCVFAHDTSIGGGGYGQNLAAGTAWSKDNVDDVINNGWYGEAPSYVGQYGKATPDMNSFGKFGHFTQLVWKKSTGVGCVTFDCSTKGGLKDSSGNVLNGLNWYTVCNYYPPGNYLGQFASNVARPIGLPPYTS